MTKESFRKFLAAWAIGAPILFVLCCAVAAKYRLDTDYVDGIFKMVFLITSALIVLVFLRDVV